MMSWTRPPKLFRYIYPHSKWECWLEQDILFTFDDGPGPHTDELLNLSQGYNIKFAFFILPQQAQKYPEIVRRIVKEDHIFCHNCGWTGSPVKWVQEVTGKNYIDIINECKDIDVFNIPIEKEDKLIP